MGLLHCARDSVRSERQVSCADTHRIEQSVGHGCRRRPRSAFANAQRGFARPAEDQHLDVRYLIETQDRITFPGTRQHPFSIPQNLLLESPTDRLNNPAFDLIREPVGVDHPAGVDRGDDARHSQGRADFDLRDHRTISAAILIAGESEAAPASDESTQEMGSAENAPDEQLAAAMAAAVGSMEPAVTEAVAAAAPVGDATMPIDQNTSVIADIVHRVTERMRSTLIAEISKELEEIRKKK